MITSDEVAALIDEARVLNDASFPPAHLHVQQIGMGVVVSRQNEDGRPGSYVSDTVVMSAYDTAQRKAAVDLVVRCAERAHRRRLAISAWNVTQGRQGDALALWATWMHEGVLTFMTRRAVDLEKALRTRGSLGLTEVPEMGTLDLREDGSAYLYDGGWAGVSMTIAATSLPTTVVQALPGRTLGETIAHPDLPADMLIRSARMQGDDLLLGLEPRYVPVSAPPKDGDMAWRAIGVAPWQRADFVALPVDP